MKKIKLLIIGLLAIVFAGCGEQSNPEKTVKAFHKAIYEKDFGTAASYILSTNAEEQAAYTKMLKDIYKGDNAIINFHVYGAAFSTKDAAKVAVSTEVAKASKGMSAKDVMIIPLVKSEGSWYINLQ